MCMFSKWHTIIVVIVITTTTTSVGTITNVIATIGKHGMCRRRTVYWSGTW